MKDLSLKDSPKQAKKRQRMELEMTATTIKQKRDPTPSEIAAACLLIQLSWSPQESLRRLRADWRPMVKAGDDRLETMTSGDYHHHLQKEYDACHE